MSLKFDALEELVKARKAKGLDNWTRLKHLSSKLAGKKSKDITFTCTHPKHGASGDRHNLGSVEGNLHFLLGYGNPGFHLAPYHWQIVYPELTEEEAVTFAAETGHPTKPRFWRDSTVSVGPEGDLEEGVPHPYASRVLADQAKDARVIKANSRYGTYYADPATRTIHDPHTDKTYSWDLIKNSYFAYENPKIVEAMEATDPPVVKSHQLPEMIRQLTVSEPWAADVYPLVKSLFPKPGSVVLLPTTGGETVYGLVKANKIDIVDAAGNPVAFPQYDRDYESLDLTKSGDLHPSILYNFATSYLSVDGPHFLELTKSQTVEAEFSYPTAVEGHPSPGYTDTSSTLDKEAYTARTNVRY